MLCPDQHVEGPFKVDLTFVPRTIVKTVGISLFITLLVGGFGWLGWKSLSSFTSGVSTWRNGVEYYGKFDIGGMVSTTNFIYKRYDLDISYTPPESDTTIQFKAKFPRFFTGPNSKLIELRYLPKSPQMAMISWQVQSKFSHVSEFLFAFLLMFLFSLGAFAIIHDGFFKISTLFKLSSKGKLIVADVLGIEKSISGKKIEFKSRNR